MTDQQIPPNDVSTEAGLPPEKAPHSGTVLTLGILSIIGGCCLSGIPGLILAAIAIYLYKKGNEAYLASPESYIEKSYNNLKLGRTFAIVGFVVSIIMLILNIYLMQTGILDEWMQQMQQMDQDMEY